MKIVADRAIPYIEHYFSGLGELVLCDGRAIDAAAVHDADVLIVRTVTRVDAELLAGSRVGFVASATSGTNHVDKDWLAAQGIGFASAAGCNARAVAEYVLSSLFVLAEEEGRDPASLCVGLVGCGHVGSTLRRFLSACGIETLVCDPPLAESGSLTDIDFQPLAALREADIITLHVPLETGGAHPTAGMIDDEFLGGLRNNAVLINTARGEVLDEAALADFLYRHPQAAAVIDVWRGEPAVNTELLRRVRIGTPHIAGYTLDAKRRGTRMVFEAVCNSPGSPGRTAGAVTDPELPGADRETLMIREPGSLAEAVGLAVLSAYDVRGDSAALAAMPDLDESGRREYFDDLRNHYPLRREFSAMNITLRSCPPAVGEALAELGFHTVPAGENDGD